MARFRPYRPSPAMAVALLALFVALGGTGYAALKLPQNSVGANQIKKNAVRAGEISRNAISSPKVKNRSLLAQDFKAGELPRGAQGPQGLQGPAGAPNPNAANADKLDGKDSSAFSSSHFGRLEDLPANSLIGFGTPEGTSSFAATESDQIQLSPHRTLVARDLSVELTAAPGGVSAERFFRLQINGGDSGVGCNIEADDTTCDSGGATAVIPPGSLLSIRQAGNNTPDAATALFGWSTVAP